MKWTEAHDIELCKEVVVSKLFETEKMSIERGQIWEFIAKNLEKLEYPCFHIDQRSVRDRLRKLLIQFRKKDREERNASGISPEQSELDAILEDIDAREEASDTLAAAANAEEKEKVEADKVAAGEIRKRAMENLSQTKKRNEGEQGGRKRKVRKGGSPTLEFLKEKVERDKVLKEESNRLERDRIDLERERIEMEKDNNKRLMEQQSQLLATMTKMQTQLNSQMQANQIMLMQQQQQQGQALMTLLAKLADK
jgi:hypothetical protein